MVQDKKKVKVIVLTKDSEVSIISTLQLIRFYIVTKVQTQPNITVIDNGSEDRTVELVKALGTEIIHHFSTESRAKIIKEALGIGKREAVRTLIILDLKGGNDAEDVISLISRSLREEDLFASAYIQPTSNQGGIGCWAIDSGLLTKIDGDFSFDIERKMVELSSSEELEVQNINERFRINSKKIRKKILRSFFRSPIRTLTYFIRSHPLTIFGGIGTVVLLSAVGAGIYTINFFYRNNYLNFFPAIFTIALVMIGGFLMVAGLMLNALNVLVERLEAIKKWI